MNKQLAFPVRPPRINSGMYADMFPERIAVHREGPKDWQVWRGEDDLKSFRSHANAIRWAQKKARRVRGI